LVIPNMEINSGIITFASMIGRAKAKKINLNVDYRVRAVGRALNPITLTEAFGCDRCQQLFVVEDNGYVLEQLSTSYP